MLEIDLTDKLTPSYKKESLDPITLTPLATVVPDKKERPFTVIRSEIEKQNLLELLQRGVKKIRALLNERNIMELRGPELRYIEQTMAQIRPEANLRHFLVLLEHFDHLAESALRVAGKTLQMAVARKMPPAEIREIVEAALLHNIGDASRPNSRGDSPLHAYRLLTHEETQGNLSALVAGMCYEREGRMDGFGIVSFGDKLKKPMGDLHTKEMQEKALRYSQMVAILAQEESLRVQGKLPIHSFIAMVNQAKSGAFALPEFQMWYRMKLKEPPLKKETIIPFYMLDTQLKMKLGLFATNAEVRNAVIVLQPHPTDPMKATVQLVEPRDTHIAPHENEFQNVWQPVIGQDPFEIDLSYHMTFNFEQGGATSEEEEDFPIPSVFAKPVSSQHTFTPAFRRPANQTRRPLQKAA